MRFATPLAFLLLLLLPVLFRLRSQRRGGALRYSAVALFQGSGTSLRQRLHSLPLALRLCCLALIVVALARPQQGLEKIQDVNHGIAIEMVLDRSSSMRAPFRYQGTEISRLDAAKQIFAAFVQGGGQGLAGRPSDLVGMVSFARFPQTNCPLTLAHDALSRFLDTITLVDRKQEDGTAIGDAIALAAARLEKAEESLPASGRDRDDSYRIKSKIIILLTDGENNMGKLSPVEAAELAKKWGIRIYAIGVGGAEVMQVRTIFGNRTVRTGRGADGKTLEEIARITGGRFWLAEDGDALKQVYREIDQLEKSEVESVRYIDYRERFVPLALAALLLLLAETGLAATVFRRLP
ncbi:MAG: VWA domain-containing protein [Thermodesulfobacteriota bacterium]